MRRTASTAAATMVEPSLSIRIRSKEFAEKARMASRRRAALSASSCLLDSHCDTKRAAIASKTVTNVPIDPSAVHPVAFTMLYPFQAGL